MLLCAGLFRLLMDVRSGDDPVAVLRPQLKQVPLERLAPAGSQGHDDMVCRYEVFMGAMSEGLADALRDNRGFDTLISNGVALADVISQIFSTNHGDAMVGGWFGEFR